jgi:hypothetical protein
LSAQREWFSGGERLPYDPERARFDDSSALRVFVRHASGGATTLTPALHPTDDSRRVDAFGRALDNRPGRTRGGARWLGT